MMRNIEGQSALTTYVRSTSCVQRFIGLDFGSTEGLSGTRYVINPPIILSLVQLAIQW